MRANYEFGETAFIGKQELTFYWTSETGQSDNSGSPVLYLAEGIPTVDDVNQPTMFGGSVRCIQDEDISPSIIYGDVDSNTLVQFNDALITLKYSVGLNPMPKTDPLPWEDWRVKAANVDAKKWSYCLRCFADIAACGQSDKIVPR